MRKYRNELKYIISKDMAEVLKQRLGLIMDVDSNSVNPDNSYLHHHHNLCDSHSLVLPQPLL